MIRLGVHLADAARVAAEEMFLRSKVKVEFEYARAKYFVATKHDCTCETLLGTIDVDGKTVYICLPKNGVKAP